MVMSLFDAIAGWKGVGMPGVVPSVVPSQLRLVEFALERIRSGEFGTPALLSFLNR